MKNLSSLKEVNVKFVLLIYKMAETLKSYNRLQFIILIPPEAFIYGQRQNNFIKLSNSRAADIRWNEHFLFAPLYLIAGTFSIW